MCAIVAALFISNGDAANAPLSAATIVVYNAADAESVELAKFYAEKRSIPRDHLVALTCSKDEEISREEYDASIAEPLRKVFVDRKWWSMHESAEQKRSVASTSIRFVALMKGVPLKIRATTNYPQDQPREGPLGNRNEASVDQELSALGLFSHQISGATPNAYFQSYKRITEFENPATLLVCRLDAPSAATVRRMIVDAIETEKNGLWGRAYIDGAHNTSGGFAIGEKWLSEIPYQLHKVGIPVVHDDSPAIFTDAFPVSDCALYYGWYAGSVAGPFTQPGFHFTAGAIAVHIHSFSASTLRDRAANWAGPLLTVGAAATIGNVYEPYLQLTTHVSILNDRLLHGFTFAESAYMSLPTISWMAVAIGDPLYRPYASWLELDSKTESGKGVSDWQSYHDFVSKNAGKSAPELRSLAKQTASRLRSGPMLEDVGLMEMRDGNVVVAISCFQQARAIYTQRDDILRATLEEADAWVKQNKPKRALDLVRVALRVVTDSPTQVMLKKLESEISARAAPPARGP